MANMLMILAPGIIHAYDPVAIVQAPGIQLSASSKESQPNGN